VEINRPDVLAEVTAAFMKYQRAVDSNDVEVMNDLFWQSPFTVRYAYNGTLTGHAAIAAFRQNRSGSSIDRTLQNTVITTFGLDFAATNTESIKPGHSRVSRQSQSWVRMPHGWRIVAAHVSDCPDAQT